MTATVKSASKFGTTDRLAALRLQLMAGENAKRIGRRIRQRRIEVGLLRQRDLAEKIGGAVDNQRVSDWERGVNTPSDRYLQKLADALEVDVAYFMLPEPEPGTPDLMSKLSGDDRLEARLQAIEEKLNRVLLALEADTLSDSVRRTSDGLLDTAGADTQAPGDTERQSDERPAKRPARPRGKRSSG